MTYYPIFIPMYMGGGGGPSSKKEVLIFLSIYATIIVGFISFTNPRPRFQMKITQKKNYSGHVDIRIKNYPHIIKLTNNNTECLKRKGYSLHQYIDRKMYSPYWENILYLERLDETKKYNTKHIELSKEKLIADCKECDVHTEIIYNYDNIFGNEKQKKKKLYWHKCYVDELK